MDRLIKVDPKIFDNEIDFFPLYNGLKPSSMGLKKINCEDNAIEEEKKFLFGESFKIFRKNKEWCRRNDFERFYQKKDNIYPEIIKHIIHKLSTQNSDLFTLKTDGDLIILDCHLTLEQLVFNKEYELVDQKTELELPFIDSFDALSMQVPEDLVIHHVPSGQLNVFKSESEKKDFAAAIHLCHCNGWTAEGAIGKTFDEIHEGVPRINKIIPNATRMMLSFLNKNITFERIAAISIKTTDFICRHEEMMKSWSKPFNKKKPMMHLRVERQTVTGFPNSEAFLFTIRTFLYDLSVQSEVLSKDVLSKRKDAVIAMIENPHPESYAYNVITKHQKTLLEWLKP